MTFMEKLLRAAVKEANEKGQEGFLIWASWIIWDEVADELKEGNEHYDFALTQIANGEEGTITLEWFGFTLPAASIVPIEKMASEQYFQKVLKICEAANYQGPITLLPLNEVAEVCNKN